MNTRRLLLACTLLFGSALHAATPADYHAELRALKTTYENAINSGDLAPLATLFDAETTGVTVDNQSFHNFAELKAIYERFHSAFPGVVYKIQLDAEPSQLFQDIAITHGTAKEYVKTTAAEFTYTSTWTVVLRRTDSGWKLVRSQVTMDPFRNSIVSFFEQKAKVTYGIGGLACGIALGLLIGVILRRRAASAT
jgi:hypothetical protein